MEIRDKDFGSSTTLPEVNCSRHSEHKAALRKTPQVATGPAVERHTARRSLTKLFRPITNANPGVNVLAYRKAIVKQSLLCQLPLVTKISRRHTMPMAMWAHEATKQKLRKTALGIGNSIKQVSRATK